LESKKILEKQSTSCSSKTKRYDRRRLERHPGRYLAHECCSKNSVLLETTFTGLVGALVEANGQSQYAIADFETLHSLSDLNDRTRAVVSKNERKLDVRIATAAFMTTTSLGPGVV
jgi:hypothetical protein